MKAMSYWLAGLSLMITAGAASAVTPEPDDAQQARFQAWDTDADGFVTRAEAEKIDGLPTIFDQVDANDDGKLDKVEYTAFEGAQE